MGSFRSRDADENSNLTGAIRECVDSMDKFRPNHVGKLPFKVVSKILTTAMVAIIVSTIGLFHPSECGGSHRLLDRSITLTRKFSVMVQSDPLSPFVLDIKIFSSIYLGWSPVALSPISSQNSSSPTHLLYARRAHVLQRTYRIDRVLMPRASTLLFQSLSTRQIPHLFWFRFSPNRARFWRTSNRSPLSISVPF
ncbi:hypothetical protein FNV43_RR19920 [Rhamnella rubrinervis]|uniref:Uncharacterized protein n=1 Tax=Rhamnella rubrinervis TaxID=2594499 RepID=A0A8K0E5G5_9ROSA|nr:hypothetical protein FNV43_RR19920 [Rhamnella rubrinervis]